MTPRKNVNIDVAMKDMDGVGSSKNTRPSADSLSHDPESDIAKGETTQLKRRLQSRHLQMIAIGKHKNNTSEYLV